VTECLRLLTENTAGAPGKYISVSYEDVLHPKQEDARSADEIIADMNKKFAKFGGEE